MYDPATGKTCQVNWGAIRNLERLLLGRKDCKTAVDPGLFQNSIRKVVLDGERGASAG
jgi:hypothetical protein